MARAAFYTFGCKVNQCETESLIELFINHGFSITDFNNSADIYIVNSCTVTNKADYKSREFIRRAYRLNPNAVFIVIGCSVENYPEKFSDLKFIDYLIGTGNKMEFFKNNLPNITKQPETKIIKSEPPEYNAPVETVLTAFRGHTRSFIKIQDGCNYQCTYCAVRLARGKSRSKNPDFILNEINNLVRNGFKEIVISGVHLGLYGKDLSEDINLNSLIMLILKETPVQRIRISSIDPEDLNDTFIELFKSFPEQLCRHLHISFQSFSDKILSAMKRRNTKKQISNIIFKLREAVPLINIGGDIIVGFPGESENEFLETYNTLSELDINYFHIFPYSKKEGTPAAQFNPQVHGKIKSSRAVLLKELNRKKRTEFIQRLKNIELPFLIEIPPSGADTPKGISDNYLRVAFPGINPSNYNKIIRGKITKTAPLTGSVIN